MARITEHTEHTALQSPDQALRLILAGRVAPPRGPRPANWEADRTRFLNAHRAFLLGRQGWAPAGKRIETGRRPLGQAPQDRHGIGGPRSTSVAAVGSMGRSTILSHPRSGAEVDRV